MNNTAIILGATGLTGNILLKKLLKDESFSKVKLFSRTSVEENSPKIEEHLIDLFHLEKHASKFTGDVVFCCVGTTKSKTPDKEVYRKIDYGIPVTAAKLAKKNDISHFIVISAMGADPNSRIFYNKTKGEMERDVLEEGIEHTYILQPSLIDGNRTESRTGEKLARFFMGLFSFLIPKKYKMIKAETIAEAMNRLFYLKNDRQRIPSKNIKRIASHD